MVSQPIHLERSRQVSRSQPIQVFCSQISSIHHKKFKNFATFRLEDITGRPPRQRGLETSNFCVERCFIDFIQGIHIGWCSFQQSIQSVKCMQFMQQDEQKNKMKVINSVERQQEQSLKNSSVPQGDVEEIFSEEK